ncbi:unnamed protein product [Alopecurus aequalis]
MAAAVLGQAARRLGGSGGALRQTAVSRLSSRFAHTEVQNPCICGKYEKNALKNRIQKQKEELYDAVAEAHNKYGMDRSLLRELSDHVKRPGDPTWDMASTSQMKHDLLKATGFVTLHVGGIVLFCKVFCGVKDWLTKK